MKCALSQDFGAVVKTHDSVALFLPQDQVHAGEGAFLSGVRFPGIWAAIGIRPCNSSPGSTRQVSP